MLKPADDKLDTNNLKSNIRERRNFHKARKGILAKNINKNVKHKKANQI